MFSADFGRGLRTALDCPGHFIGVEQYDNLIQTISKKVRLYKFYFFLFTMYLFNIYLFFYLGTSRAEGCFNRCQQYRLSCQDSRFA